MKYCTIRIPEPIPFGLTLLLAMALAIVSAFCVNRFSLGKVETVFTPWTHFRFLDVLFSVDDFLGFAFFVAIRTLAWDRRRSGSGRLRITPEVLFTRIT